MSTSAEVVQALLGIVVIGLAIRNGKLKREKELLFKQLCRMRDREEGGKRELFAMQAKQEIAEVPEVETDSWRTYMVQIQNTSCPDCGSTDFEMRTYGGPWEYADTHCAKCGKLIRRFDAA